MPAARGAARGETGVEGSNLNVEDGESSLFAPDVLTPSQWSDFHRDRDDPIRNLMLAVLEISLRDATSVQHLSKARRNFRLSARARARADAQRSRRARKLAAEAIAWMLDDGGEGPFTFRNVCSVLEIDSEELRAQLIERRAV